MDDIFELYDLIVEVSGDKKKYVCGHKYGSSFKVIGENFVFDKGGEFSFYSLAAIIPLIAAKQRRTDKNDWMTTDDRIACPDPHCKAVFLITREQKRKFKHSETTVT